MKLIFLSILVLASLIGYSQAGSSRCPKPNMVWSDCASACEPTCGEQPEICILICLQKCVCIDGYILDANGNCILRSECP
ncbi:unnamed protein product [Chironomus riparius]|uniref:TIL domain-containing protein n=1 Tax=Chironomus riparius TaxID=315576 RepID=A0A9N9WTL5_9DIPT|nr:unnamed protein product [Chironomus riparius]